MSAAAPFHRWDSYPGLSAGSSDASGRCRWCPRERPPTVGSRTCRDTVAAWPRTWCGNQPNRNDVSPQPIPVGAYGNVQRHQDVLSKTPEPNRGTSARLVQDGRRGTVLHRHRDADIRRPGRTAARRGGGQGSRLAPRRTCDREWRQGESALEDCGTDGRHRTCGTMIIRSGSVLAAGAFAAMFPNPNWVNRKY